MDCIFIVKHYETLRNVGKPCKILQNSGDLTNPYLQKLANVDAPPHPRRRRIRAQARIAASAPLHHHHPHHHDAHLLLAKGFCHSSRTACVPAAPSNLWNTASVTQLFQCYWIVCNSPVLSWSWSHIFFRLHPPSRPSRKCRTSYSLTTFSLNFFSISSPLAKGRLSSDGRRHQHLKETG